MAVSWTPEQEQAITFRDGAAIVSAAAGSGKTAVLVERVRRMLVDKKAPVPADRMVISTFTNDAAAQLKTKLSKAIDDELAKDPSNKELAEQRIRLEDANISTISSFCLDILRRNSAAAGLQPGFSVLDESEAKLIFARSMTAVLEDFCENGDPQERDMLYDWYAGEDDRRIVTVLTTLYEFSRNIPDPGAFFAGQLALYADPENMSPISEEFTCRLIRYRMNDLVGELEGYLSELQKLTPDTPAAALPEEWDGLLCELKRADDIRTCCELYGRLGDAKLPAPPRKSDKFDNTQIKAVNDKMRDLWKDSLLPYLESFTRRSADAARCEPILGILISLTKKLDEEFSARKLEKGRVDFADIELMTLRLLKGADGEPSDIAKSIAAETDIIIVDEFQDSNEIQYQIFELISDSKKNLFFVGDIKQSIYRFRGADPLVFSRIMKDPDFTVINLNRNFRSCAEVIDSVNGIFLGTMTEQLGDVDYDSSCALVQGSPYSTDSRNRTELIVFGKGKAEENRIAEASYITYRIRKMIAEGFEITENGVKRPCRYGDFAVIMGRYSSNIGIYKAAFERSGIPFDAKSNDDYTDFSEVKHALALLRVIDDPYRDTDLALVLMKEPYLLPAQEMARIKLAGGKKNGSLWTGLIKYARTDARAAHILAEINGYRAFAEENSAARLIRHICDESMLIPAAEAAPEGDKKSRNLHKLIHYAERFTGSESASLYDFITYMESIGNGSIKLDQEKSTARADVVRIMTIHASKGLEFPVCFVSNVTSRALSMPDELICDPKVGIGMKISDTARKLLIKTCLYETVHDETERLGNSEEMRLLYVAATRAKEKLIFTVPFSGGKPDMHYGWVLGSRAVNDDRLIDVFNDPKEADDIKADDEAAEAGSYLLPDFTEYAHIDLVDIPAKVTATQIGVKSVDDFSAERDKMDRFLRMPSFIGKRETSRLTGKKRGDAYHKVMEKLDFGAGVQDVPAILDELCGKGLISDIERLSVDEEDISRFLTSGLCQRAAASGTVRREYPIFCEYDGAELGITDWGDEEKPFIQGIADMFFIEDGEIVLVDYKTNRNITADKLVEEYRGQLAVYADALGKATGMKVKQKLLYSFELGEVEIK